MGKKIVDSCGAAAPAFGMIGTLVGLVQMLAGLDDPATIGPKMAVSFFRLNAMQAHIHSD